MNKEKKNYFEPREIFLFWIGIGAAIFIGILGNLLTGTTIDLVRNGYNPFIGLIYVISLIILLVIIYLINTQLKKLKNIFKKMEKKK